MSSSTALFNRWAPIRTPSWSFQVFQKHNEELNNMMWAIDASYKFTYKNLGLNSAKWKDKAWDHLELDIPKNRKVFKNLGHWGDSFKKFEKWTRLNCLMTIASNFETYLAAIVSLALESNPGIVFDASQSIDGVILLKKNAQQPQFHEDITISVTKGDWNSRASAFQKTFKEIPKIITDNIGELEKLRNLRNKIAHAFGRDIKKARNNEVKNILPMESINKEKLLKIEKLVAAVAKSIDDFLLNNHIGEYQAIRLYHNLYPSLRKDVHVNERAQFLKKELGEYDELAGKVYCRGLAEYYEEI